MADEHPDKKAFEEYHKSTVTMGEVARGTEKNLSLAESDIYSAIGKMWNDKRADKGFLSFKDELAGRKGGEDLYRGFAQSVFANYLAIGQDKDAKETLEKALKGDRAIQQLEDRLEQVTGISREKFMELLANKKQFTIRDLANIVPNLYKGTTQMEMNYVTRKAQMKQWEDPKLFNKYIRQIVKDNKADIPEEVIEQLEKAGIDIADYDKKELKDFYDPRVDQAVWRAISAAISDKYDFKKKLEELFEKKN